MNLRFKVLAAVTVIVISCSSSAFAGDAVILKKSPKKKRDILADLAPQTKPEVSCELKVREKYEYYDIDGANVAEWRKQMRENGTKWNDGKVYSALTTWDIRYGYDVFVGSGKCSVKSVKTDVDIVYHLPRRIPANPDPELTALWENYQAHLRQHEFGHKDIAIKTATEINEILASLSGFGSEKELDKEASRRTQEELSRLKEFQVKYDHDTRHGETQGAILPLQ
jgi:predicted secreted Zn-dependent protease